MSVVKFNPLEMYITECLNQALGYSALLLSLGSQKTFDFPCHGDNATSVAPGP